MCSFTKSWSEADLGSTYQDDIDDIVEDTRYAVRERMNVEHYGYASEGSNLDVWLHRKEAGRCDAGTAANIPAAAAAAGTSGAVEGYLYRETDTGLIKRYDATDEEWDTIAADRHSAITTTYTTGTVSVTNASAVVTGSDTAFSSNVTTSDVFLGPDGEYYAITSVDSDTQVTLSRVYGGTTASGQTYTVYLDGHPQYLPKSGGTVDGPITMGDAIAMGDSKITGLAAGSEAGDAIRYEQLIGVFGKVNIGTYTGDGAATQAITGVGFEPELLIVWHKANDTYVRFKSSQDTTYSKNTGGGYFEDEIISLDEDGFTVGDGTGSGISMNGNEIVHVYVALRYTA